MLRKRTNKDRCYYYHQQRRSTTLYNTQVRRMTRSVYGYLLLFLSLVRAVRSGNSYVPGPDYDSVLHLPSGPYLDMFPLSGHNFTEKVLNSKDPWIVVFHEGVMSRNWRAMAESLRGVVWVGMIDRSDEKGLLDEIVSGVFLSFCHFFILIFFFS